MALIQPEYFSELPRHRELSRLRKYYLGKQYDGRPDFFTGKKANGEVVPLRERKPCIIYPLPKAAVGQVVKFTFGDSRFPTIGIEEIDAKKSVAGEKLSAEEAEQLEQLAADIIESCELKPAMRRVMRPGLAVGTACAFLSLVDGLISITLCNAEDVLPEFRDAIPGGEVVRAVWSYQYCDSVPGAAGKPEEKRFWFRQDITTEAFVEYKRVEVKQGEQPTWTVEREVKHGFGFCPVIWCRNVFDSDTRSIDGSSLYEDLEDEFDALNFALSQRHRGVNFWGTPQPWETGVEDDDGPPADGRTAGPAGYQATTRQEALAGQHATAPHGTVDAATAAKISPDQKWSYRSETAKVGLLETTGKAFEAGTNHVNDIRSRALEAMSVVLVNVSDIMGRTQQGQMSAKFLELAYEPLLALVDEMRHCWWPHGLKAILNAAFRIIAAKGGEGIYIPGAKAAADILKRFKIQTAVGELWLGPKMTPSWGDYFSAGPDEIDAAIKAATDAQGLVPHEDRVKYVLPYFGREDVPEALAELETEQAENAERERQEAEREMKQLHAAGGGASNAGPKKPAAEATRPGNTTPAA